MAYAALLSLAQTIDQILNQYQHLVSPREKQEITCILEHVVSLQEFLEKFPEKANSLEGRISKVATDADDVIANYMTEQLVNCNEILKKASKRQFIHELRAVTEEIGSIGEDVKDMINNGWGMDEVPAHSRGAGSSSIPVPRDENDAVGLGNDLDAIKDRLCGKSSKLQIIPIVGMGGMGKTTLARKAYDDPLIMEHFYVRAWVTISQDYSAQKIFSAILDLTKQLGEPGGQNDREKVHKSLKGWRYLIVMDDMWSKEVWDDISRCFPDDHNGSRIILTTRLSEVAAYPDSHSHHHEMHFLDENESWNLLRKKVFGHQDCPPELEDIGKQIARSCGGLPLAIVLIAGLLLAGSATPTSWREMAENVNLAVSEKGGQFEEIISLSYTHLPHHLRPCFLYMGAFPEDHEIRVSQLIKLWVAEGFLKHANGPKRLEEEAEECLEDLVKRSLVLVSKKSSTNKIKSCRVHDLVRDLCARKAREEKFLVHSTDRYVHQISQEIRKQHRIVIAFPYDKITRHPANIDGWFLSSTIRTLIFFHGYERSLSPVVKFRLLKVLDVVNINCDLAPRYPPPQVFELIHLRYFALAFSKIPPSISNLQNLQTLIIRPLRRQIARTRLPLEIWRMPQLRHLLLLGDLAYPQGATSFALENLQTLSGLVDFVCTERLLKMIPNLKKLRLYYSGGSFDRDFHLENLVNLRHLESLELELPQYPYFQLKGSPAFPTSLKKLTLRGQPLSWEDMGIIGSLPNLEVLKLRGYYYGSVFAAKVCKGTWETTEGGFLQLKFLLFERLSLRHWITQSSHFPKLECLILCDCLHLIEIPDDIGEIPTLELIEVTGKVEKSLVESAKRIREEQRELENYSLQVRLPS